MARLRQNQRQAAVQMLLGGQNQSAVARHFGVHKTTVSRLYSCLMLTGTTNDRPRSGCPRVMTPRQDHFTCMIGSGPQQRPLTKHLAFTTIEYLIKLCGTSCET